MKAAKAERKAPAREQKPRAGQPEPEKNYGVPTGDERPTWGKEDALVTIVEFSDFQCPFCSRVNPTIAKIKETYPDDVRIVFRHLPLPMHPQAPAAAKASLAAARQGKFWEMHDKLFGDQRGLSDDKYAQFAEEIGLDVDKFKKDYADEALAKMVEEDMKVAEKFGARGTPAFFINGRFVNGAQDFTVFDALIKEEKAKAEKFLKDKGVAKKDLYAEMAKGWEQEVKVPPPPPPADFKRREVSTKGLPVKGDPKTAKITIVECSDFDCPFCKRGAATITELTGDAAWSDKIAVYFAHNPLPMHKMAEPAHRASIAAEKQGKFWEMHDKLFENQKSRTDDDFFKYAEELGLDMEKFKADYAAAETAQRVQDDMKACAGYEVRGVPGFVINGRLMSGAQPLAKFKEVLEEELNGGFEATQKKAKDKAAKDGAKDGAKPEEKKPG
jgi:protein-disulfide isomerase